MKCGLALWGCNGQFFPSQFFPQGKNGPAHSFPGEKTDRSTPDTEVPVFKQETLYCHLGPGESFQQSSKRCHLVCNLQARNMQVAGSTGSVHVQGF